MRSQPFDARQRRAEPGGGRARGTAAQTLGSSVFAGARDQDAGSLPLPVRFRMHADALERHGRGPLAVELIRRAADDLEAGGVVATVFADDPCLPGSVPSLRLVGALHQLVLIGKAPELAASFYPAGVARPGTAASAPDRPTGSAASAPDRHAEAARGAGFERLWAVVRETIAANLDDVRARVRRGVQVNDPGRSAALYGVLLWLVERHRLPVRLLEIGACAGLNLIPDRYGYEVGGRALGDPSSPLRIAEPWRGLPLDDPWGVAPQLSICARRGCDPAAVDIRTPEGRVTLQSYLSPDEHQQIARLRYALSIAAAAGVTVDRARAPAWLARELSVREAGVLTVVWQSVVRQYASVADQRAIEAAIAGAGRDARERRPLAWITFEPGIEHPAAYELRCREWPGCDERLLALCGDLGPPIEWLAR